MVIVETHSDVLNEINLKLLLDQNNIYQKRFMDAENFIMELFDMPIWKLLILGRTKIKKYLQTVLKKDGFFVEGDMN